MVEQTQRDTETVFARLITELSIADQELVDADRRLQQARADHEIASIKFTALRDMLASRMSRSPYAPAHREGWTVRIDGENRFYEAPSKGRFRFLRVAAGDAVEAALEEAEGPLTLAALTALLRDGGATWANLRSVNAALTNKVGKTIGKTDDGEYHKIDPDELPFE